MTGGSRGRDSRLDGRARYTVAGEAGVWRYLGQATYVDEATGATVEHDHVRMALVGEPGVEAWVDPADVSGVATDDTGRFGVFALGAGVIAG